MVQIIAQFARASIVFQLLSSNCICVHQKTHPEEKEKF